MLIQTKLIRMKTTISSFQTTIILSALFVAISPALASDYDSSEPYQSDTAEVYISMIGVRPLNLVIEDLQPTFDLTPDQALQKAVPDTLNSSESTLSSVSAALQLGSMFGQVPTNSSSAATSGQPSPLGILTNLPTGTLSVDPVSAYQAGASLFEQVKLLNHSLQDVPHFKGYTPYIVTVQISLFPHQRVSPYDAYVNAAFFTDTNPPPTPPGMDSQTIPLIYPLLTTDALEAANDQQNLNNLRQLTTSIAAAVHGVDIQASLDKLNQNLSSVSGLNLNSLLTVGKISQNCVVVRLGARNQPESQDKFSLVPETHNVSLLVLAPTNADELEMTARTIFRNVLDGSSPKDTTHEKRAIRFESVMEDYLLYKPDSNRFKRALLHKPYEGVESKFYPYFWNLINEVYDTNSGNNVTFKDFQNYSKSFFTNQVFTNFFDGKRHLHLQGHWPYLRGNTTSMPEYKEKYDELFDIVWLDSLWLDVTRVGSSEQYANDLIPLPRWSPQLPVEDQTVLYQNNGQSTILTLVNDAGSIPTYKVLARLSLDDTNGSKMVLYSRQIAATSDGTVLNIQFPPLSAIQSPDLVDRTNHWKLKDLVLTYGQTNVDDILTHDYTNFDSLNDTNKSDRPAPPWKIDRTYGSLLAGVASNQLDIVFKPTSQEATNYDWFLDVENPIVITNNSPADGVLGKRANGVYLLKGTTNSYEVAFTFGPLLTGQSVDFNLLNSNRVFEANLNHQIVYPPNSSQTGSQPSQSGSPDTGISRFGGSN
jgi:hypothetical protein